ncbi:MAG TPA: YhfC family glutamic-type intramembrane protease [Polyangia bacterium]|jgi:uncharacterized membrane protein YhfC
MRLAPRHAALLAAVVLAGCGATPSAPPRLTAPWSDGEVTTYDLLDRRGAVVGAATWTVARADGGWRLVHEMAQGARRTVGEVVMDADLRPRRATRTADGKRVELAYDAGSVLVRREGPKGAPKEQRVAVPAGAIDNDESLTFQRALPLAAGYTVRYANVVASGTPVTMRLTVDAREAVTVPAGTFPAWRVSLAAGANAHRAWYATDPPHLMVKYENPQSGAVFALRSWRPGAGAALHGNPASAPVAPPRAGPPPLPVPFVVTSLALQLPLMILLPLALGWLIKRRFGVAWRVFGAGALTFVASQIVHLPLNWALGLLGPPRGLGLLSLPLLALAAGLSAGLCEELARFVALRFALKRARSWPAALQLGAGHGGVEAIIFGVLVALTLVNMLVMRAVPAARLGLTPEQAAQVAAVAEAYWQTPWYHALLGGLERVLALAAHIAFAVLVMRAVVRRQPAYLVAAVAAHAALDAVAVVASRTLDLVATEGVVAVMAFALLGLAFALRDPPGAAPLVDPAPSDLPAAPDPR